VEWVETTGKTVAEALDAALDQLGVDEQEAEYEVVEEAQRGLFGRLRSEARVRARVRPVRPRPKAERRDRRRRGERPGGGQASQGRGGGRSRSGGGRDGGRDGGREGRDEGARANGRRQSSSSSSGRSGSGGGGGAAANGNGTVERPAAVTAAESEVGGAGGFDAAGAEGADGGATSGGRKRRRRRGGRGGGANRTGADVSTEIRDGDEGAGRPALDVEAQREAVEEFLQGLVASFGRPEAEVTVTVVEDSTLEADVKGEELGLLVGPKGQTLQAVHELIRSMVQRRFVGESHARVRVDIAGYRQRRREALERFTRRIAEEVISSGRAKALDPMLAGDRKVVHDVANEIDGIVTRSEGEDPSRRVIIQPA
jgi:spoIIIJ-associated protein